MLVGLVLPQVAFLSFNITVNSSNSFAHYLAFPKRWHDNTYHLLDGEFIREYDYIYFL